MAKEHRVLYYANQEPTLREAIYQTLYPRFKLEKDFTADETDSVDDEIDRLEREAIWLAREAKTFHLEELKSVLEEIIGYCSDRLYIQKHCKNKTQLFIAREESTKSAYNQAIRDLESNLRKALKSIPNSYEKK